MLVLSRKNGQKIIINEDIEILVIECSQNIVKLGISAPRDVKVYREEVYREIKYANIKSNETTSELVSQLENLIPKENKTEDAKSVQWNKKTKIIKKKND